ncbi:MAG: HAD family hydrolase, partial [bacterium]
MDLKLFATDLDGTVLVDQGQYGCNATPRLKAALRALEAGGVTVCLASGRMHESIRDIARDMGLVCPIISYNGGMLRAADDTVLRATTLDPDLAAEIVDFAESRDIPLNYYADGVLYARKVQPWWDLYQGRTSSPMREVQSQRGLAGKRPFKLLIYAEAERIRSLKAELEPRLGGRCEVMITADEYLEFVPLNVDKGPSLADLAGRMGLNASQVAAAGDGWNDMGMLRWAGLGIAMASGRE